MYFFDTVTFSSELEREEMPYASWCAAVRASARSHARRVAFVPPHQALAYPVTSAYFVLGVADMIDYLQVLAENFSWLKCFFTAILHHRMPRLFLPR
jgi:hypothetical protein